MDAAGTSETGYTTRGERELEARMECLWYLCCRIPSVQTPGLTVLDETHQANVRERIDCHFRLMEKQGARYDVSGPFMSVDDAKRMRELQLTPESELDMKTVRDWFSPDFTQSVFWLCWSTKLAFRDYHSLIEVRRYVQRFMMMDYGLPQNRGILHTEFNEYDSIIKPLQVWLNTLGVRFRPGTTVTDIATQDLGPETLATGLTLSDATGVRNMTLTRDDLVFFTSGSLTQNATMGTTDTAPAFDRDTKARGCFTVWEQLAARDEKFGRPAAFLSDVEASNWMSFFLTLTGDPTLFDLLQTKTGDKAGTSCAVTVVDSRWQISFVPYSRYFPDQPNDVDVLWGYGQNSGVVGDFIQKPMRDCTGAEICSEFLYHCGLESRIPDILANATVPTCMMPYITSQFMPRKIRDRPEVIPKGCVNLAFIGQFVELPGHVVFTVETSVRTAMMAVWGLTGLNKPMVPMYEPSHDLRVIVASLKATLDIDVISAENLGAIAQASPPLPALLAYVNALSKPDV
jgi:oleate hydratase